MAKLRVAVLFGGRSAEREVSIWTGQQVLAALDPDRYDVACVDIATLGRAGAPGETTPAGSMPGDAFTGSQVPAEQVLFGAQRPDVAFLCLHGQFGEDGTIQGMLELLGIPYTGSGVLASALAMNKVVSKRLFEADGIPTPQSVTITGRDEARAFLDRFRRDPLAGAMGLPLIVKPNEQGSTIGVTIVREAAQLDAALDTALAYGPTVLVEEFVIGIEITAPILGNAQPEVLPLIEIVPSTGFFDFERKYTPGATEEIVPARLSHEQTERARELAVRSHECLGCRGLSRVDMIVAEDEIWVLEVNTIPGMTATSLLPRSAAAAGLSFPALLDRLIDLALEGQPLACSAPPLGCGA